MWTFRSAHGLWSISAHEGRYVLMFNGERLSEAETASALLSRIRQGDAHRPVCGVDPAGAGLPARLSDWLQEGPAPQPVQPARARGAGDRLH